MIKLEPVEMYASNRPNKYFPDASVALEDSLQYALEQHVSKFAIEEDLRAMIAQYIRCNVEDLFQILKDYRKTQNDIEVLRLRTARADM